MSRKPASRSMDRTTVSHDHEHGTGRCLNILRRLSDYIDDDLPQTICREIRAHLGACPHCESFVESLRQTVSLCRHRPAAMLSAADRARLRQGILKAAARR